MYSYKELRQASKINIEEKEIKIAILGNCSTQFFSTAILGYAKIENINMYVFEADYNQIDIQLMNPTAEVYLSNPDYILLWLATDSLYEEFMRISLPQRENFAEIWIEKIEGYWQQISKNTNAKIMQMNFFEIDDKALGNYSCKVKSTFIFQIRKLNYLLQEAMINQDNVYPVDLLAIQCRLGYEIFYSAPLFYNARMPVSTQGLPYIAKAVIDVINATRGRINKCLVLDLDNTIWGGIVGDDGASNIEVGELGRGHAFSDLQSWIKQLKEYGIILAVCSKNDNEVAKEPFINNPEMVLKLEDISVFVANWEDKVNNIKMIQETLNIGMDSIVFLDDNPFERNLVKKFIADITVPDLPEDPALYLEYMQKNNYFEIASCSMEDSERTKQYQIEFQRKTLEKEYTSINEYLIGLEMEGEVAPFEEAKYSRIAQLTQRSNQFNLRTIRYTSEDIKAIAENNKYLTMYFTLKDKLGDYGLVSVVILEKLEDAFFINTWLMSCRVLKRGMEEFVMNSIISKAKDCGIKKVVGEYIETIKNKMVKDIYETMGFKKSKQNQYSIDVSSYVIKKTYIKEIK